MTSSRLTILTLVLLCASCFAGTQTDSRPNILLIVADDLGYTDVGAYGGEIHTPNIDGLAAEGLLFTQFYTSPLCAPTRAMLLSGNNNHVAGMARQHGEGILGEPVRGYENSLSDRIVPFPKLLQQAGYNTFTSGKWHLGTEPENRPNTAGFTRSWSLLEGAGNHFNSVGLEEGGSIYAEDGELVEYPDGHYSTEFYTDQLIGFISEHRGDKKPFFAFAAYTSPHWPLQVPESEIEKYRGKYEMGYDRLREVRFDSAREAGVIPDSFELPPRNESVPKWESLSAEERKVASRKMEIYAAMVENLDHHVGRLVKFLKQEGLFENTLILFISDNGAAGENVRYRQYIEEHYDNSYDNLGKPDSWISYGRGWAEASSAPFSRCKGFTREGGITAPMIIAGAGVKNGGSRTDAFATVMDLAPSFLEIGNAEYPADGSVHPMLGESMLPLIKGNSERVHDGDYVTTFSHRGRAYVRQGKWKLVNLDRPFEESKMELFDLEADRGETRNLAKENPEQYQHMLNLWRTERTKLGIILPQDL